MWSKNVSTDKNFLRNILVTRGDPFVCACPRLRSSRCRQTNVESSSLYFWSIWEQHVFSFIIVHLQTKIYEVLKRASVHLPVFIHYSTGTTTNSASLVLKRVRIRCARRCCCKVFSGRRVYLRLYSPLFDWNYLRVDERDAEKTSRSFQWKTALLSLNWWQNMSISVCSKTKKKECSCLCNGGRRFFTVGGAPLWYSNRSPSKERLQKHIHWSLQLLFCFPAGTVNFLLLRHENKDRLPSFAVDLDEDPTDIFGAVCALLVFSALLKNWTFLWPCLQWKEYCDFWVISSANSTKIKLARWDMVLKS